MQANRTGQNRVVAIAATRPARQDSGLREIAFLSLAGLIFALIMMAQGIGPNALQLMIAQ
jgi:hypothetical protein